MILYSVDPLKELENKGFVLIPLQKLLQGFERDTVCPSAWHQESGLQPCNYKELGSASTVIAWKRKSFK